MYKFYLCLYVYLVRIRFSNKDKHVKYLRKVFRKASKAYGSLDLGRTIKYARTYKDDFLFSVLKESKIKPSFGWVGLKRFSCIVKFTALEELYIKRLMQFDPYIKIEDCQSSQFVGYGIGESSLNAYRKMYIDDSNVYFEKIYKIDSLDYLKLIKFHELIRGRVDRLGIYTPKLNVLNEGKEIASVYLDYVDNFQGVTIDKLPFVSIPLIKKLESVDIDDVLAGFPILKDFRKDPGYVQGFTRLSLWLHKNSFDTGLWERIENRVLSFERVLCHGDLARNNISMNQEVIDWDRWGLYPRGYDFAYVLSKSFSVLDFENLSQRFEDYFEEIDNAERNAIKEKLSFFYFCVIFYSRRHSMYISSGALKRLVIEAISINDLLDADD